MRGNAVTREFDKEWIQLRQKRARHDGSAWKKYARLVADWKERIAAATGFLVCYPKM